MQHLAGLVGKEARGKQRSATAEAERVRPRMPVVKGLEGAERVKGY